MTLALVLAASNNIGVGLLGFLVILALVVVVVLLLRSMNRHIRKVPREFDEAPRNDSAYPDRPAADDADRRDGA